MAGFNSSTFRGIDPRTGALLEPPFPVTGRDGLNEACSAAEAAFDVFRNAPAGDRADLLDRVADGVEALGHELIDRASRETGLPTARLLSERGRTVGQLRLFAEVVRRERWRRVRIDAAIPDRAPVPRPDLRMRMVPLGPVAVFGASNFPLAFSTAGGDTASALAAGCPVVVRGHPAHPGTDFMVAGAIRRAVAACGFPSGVFGHVAGPGSELGGMLVVDPRIAAMGFTGSRTGGMALTRLAQCRLVPIPVYAEMSSVNPVLLLPGALRDRAAALGVAFAASVTLGSGQFCTSPGLVLGMDGPDLEAFEAAAAEAIRNHSPQPMLHGRIRAAFAQGTAALARRAGVEELAVGLVGDGVATEATRLFGTDAAALAADPRLADEIFGASSLIVRCPDVGCLAFALRSLEGQLTVTIHAGDGDEEVAARLLRIAETKAGRVLFDDWPTGVEVSHAMVHGGPHPATGDGRSTSVGTLAIERFLRPVCYQDLPAGLLPVELRDGAGVPRLVDGVAN